MKTILLSAAAALALSMPASAENVASQQGHTVAIGDVNGSIYYTEGSNAFEVVATLSADDSDRSIRTRAHLLDGQSMTVEVPGASGTAYETLTITRTGSKLSINSEPDLRAALLKR